MFWRFLNDFNEPYMAEIFEDLQRKSQKQAVIIRSGIALFLALWVLSYSLSYTSFFYYLTLFALFIGLGLAFFILSGTRYARPWHAYVLTLADTLLVSAALYFHPLSNGSAHGLLLNQTVLYYLLLILLAALSYSPKLLLWTTAINLLAWISGFSYFLDSGDIASTGAPGEFGLMLLLQVFALLLAGGILTLSIWQLRQNMFRQIMAEREFYDILIAERTHQRHPLSEDEAEDSYIDELTGLGTRAAFNRDSAQFTRVFAEGRLTDLTIAFIDLEGYEALLARGRQAYNDMLQHFAKAAQAQFRSSDMTYRFSDTQFALLAPGASMRNANRLQFLLDNIIERIHAEGYTEINASMGLSTLYEVQQLAEDTRPEEIAGRDAAQ